MADDHKRLQELEARLNAILQRQEGITKEIMEIRSEIVHLRIAEKAENNPGTLPLQVLENKATSAVKPAPVKPVLDPAPKIPKATAKVFNLEKFIGENLASRIGIIVLVIGVGIGIKYAIEHSVLSAGMRLFLGFLGGIGVFGLGLWLKKKYHGFSAVLVSGGLAILYLMAWAGYSYYHILPQTVSFVIMTLLTVLTVRMALLYNIQFIAHLALVGAYLTPFILSNNEGKVIFLLSYMVVINIGILVLAYYRNWRPLQVVSFVFSWIIFGALTGFKINEPNYLFPGLFFSSMFYSIFYVSFIAHHLHRATRINITEVFLIIFNAFIAYLFGYKILETNALYANYSGLFTACHALPHLLLALYLQRSKNIDKQLVMLLTGLFLAFVSIAIPVQFNGNWVTLLWIAEATLLHFLGTRNNTGYLKNMAFVLYVISFTSLAMDWASFYAFSSGTTHAHFLNIQFFTTLFYVACLFFSAGAFLHAKPSDKDAEFSRFAQLMCGILLLFSGIMLESDQALSNYFIHNFNRNISHLYLSAARHYWLLMIGLSYFMFWGLVAIKWIQNQAFKIAIFLCNIGMQFIFIVLVLIKLDMLSVVNHPVWPLYSTSMRYLAFASLAIGLFMQYRLYKSVPENRSNYQVIFDMFLTGFILLTGSNEIYYLIHSQHLDIPYRLPISIWWGLVSMGLIVSGIYLQRRYLRITAFILFGITLLKILLFDSQGMENGPKTILYLVTGVLLLIVSYLYNRYKHILFGKDEIIQSEDTSGG